MADNDDYTKLIVRLHIQSCTEQFLDALADRTRFAYEPQLYAPSENGLSDFERAVRAAEETRSTVGAEYINVFCPPAEQGIDIRFLTGAYVSMLQKFCRQGAYRSQKDIILDLDTTAFTHLNRRINCGRSVGDIKYRENTLIQELVAEYHEGTDARIRELLADKAREERVKKHAAEYAQKIELVQPGEESRVTELMEDIIRHTIQIEVDYVKSRFGKFPNSSATLK
jgi:chorismate mutase